jgi:hypothetical protein
MCLKVTKTCEREQEQNSGQNVLGRELKAMMRKHMNMYLGRGSNLRERMLSEGSVKFVE